MNQRLGVLWVAAICLACDRAPPSPAASGPSTAATVAPVAEGPAAAPAAPAAAPVVAPAVAPAAMVAAEPPVAAAPAVAPAPAAPSAAPAASVAAAPAGNEVRATKADNNKSVKVKLGQSIVLTLKAPADSEWKVVGVDRTFGYPEVRGDTFTWSTTGPFDVTGEHGVAMELKARGNPEGPAKQKFSVTFVIK